MAEAEKSFEQVGHLKVGSYVLIDGFACQIKGIEKSKPGKHGSAKARITAVGIFDNSKRNLLKPTTSEVEVPWIQRRKGIVAAILQGLLQVVDEKNFETVEVPKPKDIEVKQGMKVEFLQYGNQSKIVRAFKE